MDRRYKVVADLIVALFVSGEEFLQRFRAHKCLCGWQFDLSIYDDDRRYAWKQKLYKRLL